MDRGACTVIYLDRRAHDEHVRRDSVASSIAGRTSTDMPPGYFGTKPSASEVQSNIETILSVFHEVHVCGSGSSCLSKISDLDGVKDPAPIIVLIDVPYDEEQRLKRLSREPRAASPLSLRRPSAKDADEPGDLYGMHLLTHLASEIQQQSLSKLVIPIVILSGLDRDWASNGLPSPSVHGSHVMSDTVRVVRYLDAGAVDVLVSPVSRDRVGGLATHAYHSYKEYTREEAVFLSVKRNRKLSWVGVDEAKPYSYLREAMVSGLMHGICNPEDLTDNNIDPTDIEVSIERQKVIAEAVGTWGFSAHDFTDDELLWGALLMLQHALKLPELEAWWMDSDDLITFLLVSRTAYNSFVLYHNFRHVVDVLQAVFFFLVKIGALPPYPENSSPIYTEPVQPLVRLLKPFDILTLLISAIGHDVGHPGVNNAFLVALNAPLAQLYNDRSVLESFHCAAYSQILRRYWPRAFADVAMRRLMITTILATDMGVHFKYIADMADLQKQIMASNGDISQWTEKQIEDSRDTLCGLIIKCADISNVARKFTAASRWASILTDEFSNQGEMEEKLQMKTCLFGGPPVKDDLIKMGAGQISFMSIFAKPLFQGVTILLSNMQFSVDEIQSNQSIWEGKIEAEKLRRESGNHELVEPIESQDESAGLSRPRAPLPGTNSISTRRSSFDQADSQCESALTAATEVSLSGTTSRRSSAGSPEHATAASSSRRSSDNISPTSTHTPRLSADQKPATYTNQIASAESMSPSRRGSENGSVTAIVVTETPPTPGSPQHDAACLPRIRSRSPSRSKDSKSKGSAKSEDNQPPRPVTAPSPLRTRASTKELESSYPLGYVQSNIDSATFMASPQSASLSENDLTHKTNGIVTTQHPPREWNPHPESTDSRTPEPEESNAGWRSWRRHNPRNGEETGDRRRNKAEKERYTSSLSPNGTRHPMSEKPKPARFGFRRLFGKKDRKASGEMDRPEELDGARGPIAVHNGD